MPPTPEINPNSLDSVLTRIETTLKSHVASFDSHVANTETYRKELRGNVENLNTRVSSLEGDRKKILGIAIGGGIGAGGLSAALGKLFGQQ